MHKSLTEQLKRTFRPEFMNRVDSIIVFRQLTQADIRQIVDIILIEVNERLLDHSLSLEVTAAAKDWLVEHGYDREFGARPLRRLVQSAIEDRLSDAVLSGRFSDGDIVEADEVEDEIVLNLFTEPTDDDVEETEEEPLPAA
jgi:ATP-dependent Clp protease ATP-binding subunit ClpC